MGMNEAMQGASAGSALGPWGAVAGGVLGMFSGGSGEDAARQAAAEQARQQMEWNKKVDPLSASGMRGEYANQLNTMLQGGVQGMQNDPNLQFLQNQQQQAVQRQFSAAGQQTSSNEMQALMAGNYKTNMDYFNQQYNRLATLANANGGGGAVPSGMTPGQAFQGANSTAMNYMGSAGLIGSGIQRLFGSGGNDNPNQPQPQANQYQDDSYQGTWTSNGPLDMATYQGQIWD